MAITDSNGNVIANYYYNAWGHLIDYTGNEFLAILNPIRYRSYYFDNESGLYYLNSRYYSPNICRFLNADGYAQTGQGVLDKNMFAYCGNNPVNRADPSGYFWDEVWEIAKNFATGVGDFLGITSPAYATCGGLAVADGPLPIGDVIAIAGVVALSVGALGYGIYQAVKSAPSVSIPKAKEKDIVIANPKTKNDSTIIYRYGGTNPGNLTPRKKDLRDGRGLSFSTVPLPGCSMTTIEALNSTGVVYAVRDGVTHVSVYPVGGTMSDWVSIGSSSIWTRAVKSVTIKWDGDS